MQKPRVLVTFDSMKDTNCGYFSFGKGLGDALIEQSRNRFNLEFYLFRITDYFTGRVPIVWLSRLHRLFFPLRNRYQVVHLTDQTCRLRPWRVNAKTIMTVHDLNKVHLKFSKPHRIEAFLKKMRRKMAAVDKVVAISQFVANDVLQYFPETAHKLSVVHNGVHKLSVPEGHQPKVKPGEKFLFTIGLMSVQKGFHLLPALLKDNDYELVISGVETDHKKNIIAEAEKYNCLNRLHITGPISEGDKAWYYANCSAFVFPSVAEGFGLPVIEAMHFGKPAFLAPYTSLPEVGGKVSYYFDSFEPEAMQAVFAAGMLDYETNNRAPEIRAHADNFSWEKAANQYMDLYTELLG